MKKLNEKGVGLLVPILVLVIIGLIAGVGYFVYNSQKNNKTQESTANSQEAAVDSQNKEESKSEVAKENIPEGWEKYESNPDFSFIYPNEWKSVINVKEYPLDQNLSMKFIGTVKLNERLDGWIYATTDNGATIGEKANIIEQSSGSGVKVWSFGFGDAGYGSLIPTLVSDGKLYQITTVSSCPEKTADCMEGSEYKIAYDRLVDSITLKK